MVKHAIEYQLTKNPQPKPDQNNLGFGSIFTDHLFVMDWNQDQGWHSPRIIPFGDLKVHPACGALHYGQAVFEGLKAYNSNGKITLFRPEQNFKRLNNSCKRIVLPEVDIEFCLEALNALLTVDKEWIPSLPNTSLYIRPLLFNNEAALGVHPAKQVQFVIMCSPSGSYFKGGLQPINIFVEDEYVRAVKGGVGYAKTAGNYAASLIGQLKAESYNCSQCLWLDAKEHTYVEEVGAMNIFFKIKREYYTPALSGSILPGITRDSIIQLLKSRGETVHETRINIHELFDQARSGELEEVFGSGTAAVVTPVGKLVMFNHATNTLEEVVINNFETGPATQDIYNELTGIQLGKLDDRFGWVKVVCDA